MAFKTKLEEELEREFDALKELEIGSDGHKATSEIATRFMDRAIELRKIDAEAENQARARESEAALRLEQMRAEKIDKIVGHVWSGVKVIGSLMTVWLLSKAAFTYEEKGTISSDLGKKVLGVLVPKL